jgi:hypothetical protein
LFKLEDLCEEGGLQHGGGGGRVHVCKEGP